MISTPTIYRIDSASATATIPCMLINLATEDIQLMKGEKYGS